MRARCSIAGKSRVPFSSLARPDKPVNDNVIRPGRRGSSYQQFRSIFPTPVIWSGETRGPRAVTYPSTPGGRRRDDRWTDGRTDGRHSKSSSVTDVETHPYGVRACDALPLQTASYARKRSGTTACLASIRSSRLAHRVFLYGDLPPVQTGTAATSSR